MPNVLIVEDDAESANILEQVLQLSGSEAVVALDSGDVMDNLDQIGRYDVVFLDLEMPQYTGYDLFNEIRQRPSLSHLRVIAYSIYSNEMSTARQMGFAGFMSKPLDIDRFDGLWKQILSGKAVWT